MTKVKPYLATLLSIGVLVGCATNPVVQENPVTIELTPMERPVFTEPTRYYQTDVSSGQERFYEVSNLQVNGKYQGTNEKGCTWESDGDIVSPALSWNNCGSDALWKSGATKDLQKNGEIWPLKIGNKVSYAYRQVNSKGGGSKGGGSKTTRKCEVVSSVNISAAIGDVDTYKVVCIRRKGDWHRTRTWYFSPQHPSPIKFVNQSSNNGIEGNYEFTRSEPL